MTELDAELNERHRVRDITKAELAWEQARRIADLLDRPKMQHVEMNVVKHAFKAGIAAQAATEW